MANLTPQAKRLIILGLVGIVLVGGALVVNNYFLAPAPPPPPPPIQPVLPRPAVPAPPPAARPGPQPGAPAPAPRPQVAVPSPGLATAPAPAPAAPPAPTPPPKLAMAAPGAGPYALQVGAFAVKTNAERLQKRLEEKGHTVAVRQATPRVPRHRVLVGEFSAQADADAERENVIVAGAKGAKVVSAGGGKFTVEAGTFRNLDDAIDLARELQRAGLASRIDSRPQTTGLYQVRVGAYANRQEALAQVESLRKEGLSPIVVKN